MIDITQSDPRVTKQRHSMLKEMSIDVTIGEETHTLEVKIRHEEDLQGEDKELVNIQLENTTIEVGSGEDAGEKIHSHLDDWFAVFDGLGVEDTITEFDNIFTAIWEYLEEQYLV